MKKLFFALAALISLSANAQLSVYRQPNYTGRLDSAYVPVSYKIGNIVYMKRLNVKKMLDSASGGGGGAVTSVFGRTGVVAAATNDYTWNQINKGTSSLADLTTRNFSSLQNVPTTVATIGLTDAVVGPASATDNAIVLYNSTTGKLIKNSVIIIDANGNLSMPSTATLGNKIFNTVDQTTNTEYLQTFWSSNVATIQTGNGGTGTARSLRLIGNSRTLTFAGSNAFFEMGYNTSGTATATNMLTGTRTNSSGMASDYAIGTTINQTSTGGYSSLYISPVITAVGSGGAWFINAGTNTSSLIAGTHTQRFGVNTNGKIVFNYTLTTTGTTGNQTINKPAGTVNIAAAGTTVTVTDSECTTSSLVQAWLMTVDGTAKSCAVVPGSGSFVITLNAAATGEVKLGFLVYN